MAIGPSSGSLLDFLCPVPPRLNVWFLNSRQYIARGVDNFPTVGGYEDFFFSYFWLWKGHGAPLVVLRSLQFSGTKLGPPMYKVCLEQSAS